MILAPTAELKTIIVRLEYIHEVMYMATLGELKNEVATTAKRLADIRGSL